MEKKNMYFVQVDVSASSKAQNAYLPYTAGILVASAFKSSIVKDNYTFKEFIFLRENIEDVVDRMESPAVVGFSCYCWSTEYNKFLGKAIKEKHPGCFIVFGGHDIPDDFSMLEENPFIDVTCHGEGEDTVRDLLETFAVGSDFNKVNNISFRNGDGTFTRTKTVLQTTLDYPSPYIEGWFDEMVAAHPEITFNAILETSRGCPHQCAYCDWGLLKSKTRLFSLDRIKAEIRWMCEHKIAFVWGADANFGLFDRDLEIADELVKAKKETGYPERMRMNYAKNKFENVFAIVKKFKEYEFDRVGATLSFQSMSPVVLKNIGRKNASLDFYKELLAAYNKDNMKTYSEIILGLPGETYESFIEGIGKLFEIGQHFVFEIYNCMVLPNAVLGQKDFMEEHGIKTVRVEILRPHFNNASFTVPEYNRIVVETNTMSRDKWVRAFVFGHLAKALHGNGFLRAFAIYLRYEKGLAFEAFYDGIIDYLEANPQLFVSRIYNEIKEKNRKLAEGEANERLLFAQTGEVIWEDHEYAVLNFLYEYDRFYEEITPYLKKYNIEDDIFSDLLAYQKGIMRRPSEESKVIELNYNIHKYISDIYMNKYHALDRKKHTLVMKDSKVYDNWPDFAKFVIWYGKIGWASYKDDISEDQGGKTI